MMKNVSGTNEYNYIIPVGTPFAFAMRQVFLICAEETVSDDDVLLVLEPVKVLLKSGEVSTYNGRE